MSSKDDSEARLQDNKSFEPTPEFRAKAHIKSSKEYEALYNQSIEDPGKFWSKMANKEISWFKKWKRTMNADFEKAKISWFNGGKLNVSYNCIDRHLNTFRKNKAALIWEAEGGETITYTYLDLYRHVCRFANLLKKMGNSGRYCSTKVLIKY
jgi:acetyl-CoA synthetase